ncbi:SGNH/GDSL hydrolase family protein [Streptomyces sp. NPDC005955]|uniref:SGNH/GDSL hydrolase family protein n=1 Tax=Streptomyces sp. NPDC005955 TaxID=3364738 RepID=UPI0036B81F57
MARTLFGGTAADVAEDLTGARMPGAVGTVWDGPGEGASPITDLTDLTGAPLAQLVADSEGVVRPFYGPETERPTERVYADFGGGRVALVATDVGDRLSAHQDASDPHGSQARAVEEISAQKGIPGGFATLDASGRVPVQQLGQHQAGVYAPQSWGAHWRAARDAALSARPARALVVGGSASQGYYATHLHTGGWVGLVRNALQAQYGDGGSGLFPASRTSTFISSPVDASAVAAWLANGSLAAQSGVWTLGGSNYGPGATYVYSQTTGASIEFTISGTTARIFTVTGGATRAGFRYEVDGGAPVAVADAGGSNASIQTTTVTGLGPGTHTVKVTWAGTSSGTGQYLSVVGVSGENATGVVVDNAAKAGARAATYGNPAPSALNAVWNGGVSYPADLCIFTAGPNDAVSGTSGDQWAASVAKYFRAIREANGSADLMILLPHLGNHDTTNYLYQDYALRARGLADVYGAALIDMWAIGRNSWSHWHSRGHWGTAAHPGASGSDSVHLSDAGYSYVADVVKPVLMA